MEQLHKLLYCIALVMPAIAGAQSYDASFQRYKGLRYTCNGNITPVVTIKNTGSAAMSTCVVDTWKNGIQVGSFNWQLAVAALPNESRSPALPVLQDLVAGDQLEFRIMSVNGIPDEDATSNILAITVEPEPPTAESFVVRVFLPAAGSAGTTWRVINELGQAVVQGGPYTQAVDTEVWVTLEAARCYALELSGESSCTGRLFSEGLEMLEVACSGQAGTFSEGFLTGNTVGVEQEGLSGNMLVGPNPTDGRVRVSFPGASLRVIPIQVTDAIGRVVHVPAEGSAASLTLDFGSLPNGLYIIRSSTEAGRQVFGRVVVER